MCLAAHGLDLKMSTLPLAFPFNPIEMEQKEHVKRRRSADLQSVALLSERETFGHSLSPPLAPLH